MVSEIGRDAAQATAKSTRFAMEGEAQEDEDDE